MRGRGNESLRSNVWAGIGFALGAVIVSAALTAVVFGAQAIRKNLADKRAEREAIDSIV